MSERVYNFSAGPSMLPLEALERAGREITNYQGTGMSVMEMSHRSKAFQKIFDDTQAKLRKLMNVPEGYKILFLQTGASGQFSMVPLNLIGKRARRTTPSPATSPASLIRRPGSTARSTWPPPARTRTTPISPPRTSWTCPLTPAISTTAPTTPSSAPSGPTFPRRGMCPWCATCPRTFCPGRWT